jgi:hypothetical protein
MYAILITKIIMVLGTSQVKLPKQYLFTFLKF